MSAGRPRLPAGRKLLHLNVQVTPEQKAWLAREPFGLSFATRRAIAIAMNQPEDPKLNTQTQSGLRGEPQ